MIGHSGLHVVSEAMCYGKAGPGFRRFLVAVVKKSGVEAQMQSLAFADKQMGRRMNRQALRIFQKA